MGVVTFLQNHYSVPHVAVNKANQEVDARQQPNPQPSTGHYTNPSAQVKNNLYNLGYGGVGVAYHCGP